jgi:hypothetical protein
MPVTTTAYAKQYVRLTDDLKRALVEDAERNESSVNAIAVTILADAFDVVFDRPARARTAEPTKTAVVLDMPNALRLKIAYAAAARDASKSDVIRGTIADHYGMRYDAPPRGRQPVAA